MDADALFAASLPGSGVIRPERRILAKTGELGYIKGMEQKTDMKASATSASAKARREIAMHLQHIEGSPATPEQKAMFETFEREGWSNERRIAYIRERAKAAAMIPAAE